MINVNLPHISPFMQTAVERSAFYLFQFSVSLPHRLSRKHFKNNNMKFFKSDEQEIRFCIVGTIICSVFTIIVKILKLMQ
jgi:hypothetical protein